jgi:hypothetical protein
MEKLRQIKLYEDYEGNRYLAWEKEDANGEMRILDRDELLDVIECYNSLLVAQYATEITE